MSNRLSAVIAMNSGIVIGMRQRLEEAPSIPRTSA